MDDGDGGIILASKRKSQIEEIMANKGFGAPKRVDISGLAAAVMDESFGGGGAAHYSQLSTAAHSAGPMLAIHMSTASLRPSRAITITAATDATMSLIVVINEIVRVFQLSGNTWGSAVPGASEPILGLAQSLNKI